MSMTPMNNFDYLERVKFSEELAEIESAKTELPWRRQ